VPDEFNTASVQPIGGQEMTIEKLIQPEKRVLTIQEASKVLRIGRDLTYDLVKDGTIPSIKLGRIYRVPIVQLNAYIAGERRATG